MAKKAQNKQKERLFEEKLVPAKPGSDRLFDVSYGAKLKAGRVPGDDVPERRGTAGYFMEKLRRS